MKKILLFILLLSCLKSFGQFPQGQSTSSPTSNYIFKGGVQTGKGFINAKYVDTTAANSDYIDYYTGAQIYCTGDGYLYIRDTLPIRWSKLAKYSDITGGGSGITSIGEGLCIDVVNDSTVKVDTACIALYFLRRGDSSIYATPHYVDSSVRSLTLITANKGTGQQTSYDSGDTLYFKRMQAGPLVIVETLADSSLKVSVDTAALRDSIISIAGDSSPPGQLVFAGTYGDGTALQWWDTTRHRLAVNDTTNGFIYHMAITDSISNVPPDADALAYIAAEEAACSCDIPTDDEEAINDAIVLLKDGANAWGESEGIYLFFGSGLVNAKNPGTFDLIQGAGSATFDSEGANFNGTTAILRTQIVPSTDISADSESFAFYVKSSTDDKAIFGSISAGVGGTYFLPRSSGSTLTRLQSADQPGSANASAVGLYVGSLRTGAPKRRVTKDGVEILAAAGTTTGRSVYEFYLGGINNNNAPGLHNACTLGFVIIGNTLTDTQMGEIYTAMSAFITATGRN